MNQIELGPQDTQPLIACARQKFVEERFPLVPDLRPIREALAKLDPKLAPEPLRAETLRAGLAGAAEEAAVTRPELPVMLTHHDRETIRRQGNRVAMLTN